MHEWKLITHVEKSKKQLKLSKENQIENSKNSKNGKKSERNLKSCNPFQKVLFHASKNKSSVRDNFCCKEDVNVSHEMVFS